MASGALSAGRRGPAATIRLQTKWKPPPPVGNQIGIRREFRISMTWPRENCKTKDSGLRVIRAEALSPADGTRRREGMKRKRRPWRLPTAMNSATAAAPSAGASQRAFKGLDGDFLFRCESAGRQSRKPLDTPAGQESTRRRGHPAARLAPTASKTCCVPACPPISQGIRVPGV